MLSRLEMGKIFVQNAAPISQLQSNLVKSL